MALISGRSNKYPRTSPIFLNSPLRLRLTLAETANNVLIVLIDIEIRQRRAEMARRFRSRRANIWTADACMYLHCLGTILIQQEGGPTPLPAGGSPAPKWLQGCGEALFRAASLRYFCTSSPRVLTSASIYTPSHPKASPLTSPACGTARPRNLSRPHPAPRTAGQPDRKSNCRACTHPPCSFC